MAKQQPPQPGRNPEVTGALEDLGPFVGTNTVKRYTSSETAPCVVGRDRYSYSAIAQRTGLPAGRAARLITKIASAHGAVSMKDFYNKSSYETIARQGFGDSSLLMLLQLFHSEGLDVWAWARKSKLMLSEGLATFSTLKKRHMKATGAPLRPLSDKP